MKISKIVPLIVCIAITELAGVLGSVSMGSSLTTWYVDIVKSPLNPPNWVFGPVWTTLFLLMGIALYVVWMERSDMRRRRRAVTIFSVQLVLNIMWSMLFFGLQNPVAAFIEIIALWCAILATIVSFYKVKHLAAWLLIPYILWVSFASYLNFYVAAFN